MKPLSNLSQPAQLETLWDFSITYLKGIKILKLRKPKILPFRDLPRHFVSPIPPRQWRWQGWEGFSHHSAQWEWGFHEHNSDSLTCVLWSLRNTGSAKLSLQAAWGDETRDQPHLDYTTSYLGKTVHLTEQMGVTGQCLTPPQDDSLDRWCADNRRGRLPGTQRLREEWEVSCRRKLWHMLRHWHLRAPQERYNQLERGRAAPDGPITWLSFSPVCSSEGARQ